MANNKFRVVIPDNADEFLILIDNIIARETSLAPNGVLSPVELNTLLTLRNAAFNANQDKKALEREAEVKTRERDNAFGRAEGQGVNTPNTCEYFVTQLRDLVLARNKQNPKILGEWGFDVNDSVSGADTPPTP